MAEKPRHEYAYTDSDDWQNVQDRRERKKIQNRLSQRKRRQKVRAENAAANNAGNTERTPSTSSQGAGSQHVTLDSGFRRESRSPHAAYDQLTYPTGPQSSLDAYPRMSRATASTGNIEQWPSSNVDPRSNLDVPVPAGSPPYLTYSHSAPTSLLADSSMMQPASQFSNPYSSSSAQQQYLSTGYPQESSYGSEQGLPRYDSLSYRNSSVDASSYIGSAHVSPNIVGGSMSLAREASIMDPIALSRRGSQMSPFDSQTLPMAQEGSYAGSALPSPMPQQGMFMNPVSDSYASQPLTYNATSEYTQGDIMPGPSIGTYIGSSNLQRSPSGGRKPGHNSRVSPY